MKKTINMTLSSESVQDVIKALQDYKNDLEEKMKLFMEKLSDIGVTVAEDNSKNDSHHFDKMVSFKKEWNDGYLYVIGYNSDLSKLHNSWYDGEGNYHDETISPILALEFGTAGLAIKGMKGSAAVTNNHTDDTVWYYYEALTKNGKPTKRHLATAEEPHEMMYHAAMQMRKDIQNIAKEVWGNGR